LAAKVAPEAPEARVVLAVADLAEVGPAAAEPVVLEVEAAVLAVAEGDVAGEVAAEVEEAAVVLAAAGSAISETSSPISPTALSSGPAETAG
jgi:hypothetical protein